MSYGKRIFSLGYGSSKHQQGRQKQIITETILNFVFVCLYHSYFLDIGRFSISVLFKISVYLLFTGQCAHMVKRVRFGGDIGENIKKICLYTRVPTTNIPK